MIFHLLLIFGLKSKLGSESKENFVKIQQIFYSGLLKTIFEIESEKMIILHQLFQGDGSVRRVMNMLHSRGYLAAPRVQMVKCTYDSMNNEAFLALCSDTFALIPSYTEFIYETRI